MSKNAKIIIFSLIGLAVLTGVTIVLMLTSPAMAEGSDTGEGEVDVSNDAIQSALTLCDREESETDSIEVTNAYGTFTLVPDGVSGGNVTWTVMEVSSAPILSESAAAAAGYAVYFEAKEFVEEVSDSSQLAKYGLAEPQATVKAYFSDGTDFSFRVGNDVPNTTTSVYVTADGKNVYTAYKSRMSSYTGKATDFVDLTVMPVYDTSSSEAVEKMTIERVDFDEPLIIESIESEDEDIIQVYSYRLTSPYTAYADLTDAPNFIYGLFGLNAASAEIIEPANEDIEAAGLNVPNCVVTVETNKKTYTLTVGAALVETTTDDEGKETKKLNGFYGMSSEVPNVIYRFSAGSIPALTVEPQEIMSKKFLMPYIYSLKSLSYSDSDGRSIDIGIETVKADGEGSEDTHNFTVNGEKWDDQACKNLYQYLISASGEELYFDEEKGDLIAEISYNYADASDGVNGKDIVRFYSSTTDRKVIINLNGENLFKTRQMYATQLFSNIQSFLDGGEITLTY